MWERVSIIILVAILLFSFGLLIYGDFLSSTKAAKASYPIIVNGAKTDLPQFLIGDKLYLPMQALCEICGIDVNYEGNKICINTQNSSIEEGLTGDKGWIKTKSLNYEISKDLAEKIADDVFLNVYGKDFVEKTEIKTSESEDKTEYEITRYSADDEKTVVVRKSDGKILKVIRK
ncbi:MAG: hypothetical protein GX196_06280 [Clostridiaceae bacterium]|nr:hypothetical protein [Clostridiaceae bacterium]